jgi:hypothetical protein
LKDANAYAKLAFQRTVKLPANSQLSKSINRFETKQDFLMYKKKRVC